MRVALAMVMLLGAASARADDGFSLARRDDVPGGVLMPSVLPKGALALYAEAGVPFVNVGFRQGFGVFELEGRASFDFLDIDFALEGIAKLAVIRRAAWDFAPYLGIGFAWDAGATFVDPYNFEYVALRFLGGGTATFALGSTRFRFIGNLEVPVDAVSSPVGAVRVRPLLGAGLEYALSAGLSISFLAQAGLDLRNNPEGYDTPVGFAYGLRVGVGYRVF